MNALHPEITIRRAYADDQLPLLRLAALDSAPDVPAGPLLLAEIDGQLRVAMSLRDGAVIADPFSRTAEIVELLRIRARVTVPADGSRRSALRPQLISQLR
jgi:hypothetical protein